MEVMIAERFAKGLYKRGPFPPTACGPGDGSKRSMADVPPLREKYGACPHSAFILLSLCPSYLDQSIRMPPGGLLLVGPRPNRAAHNLRVTSLARRTRPGQRLPFALADLVRMIQLYFPFERNLQATGCARSLR